MKNEVENADENDGDEYEGDDDDSDNSAFGEEKLRNLCGTSKRCRCIFYIFCIIMSVENSKFYISKHSLKIVLIWR